MADRIPLILNTNANQIQEMPSGDTLDLTGSNINGVGIITASQISSRITGNVDIQAGVITATTIDCNGDLDVDGHINFDNLSIAGVSTFSDTVRVGTGVTIESNGQATFVGIVTFGSGSTTVNNNVVNVGTALTLGHTQGVQFHTQNLHSNGFEVNQVNASGIVTATTFSGSGASLTNLNASNIASGTVPTARLGSGTASSSTFLRGDSTFATVTSVGGDTGVDFNDNVKARFGTGNDLEIYHSGSNSFIKQTSASDLFLQCDSGQTIYLRPKANEDGVKIIPDASVELYENNVKKAETTSDGFNVEGVTYSNGLDMDDDHNIKLGTGDDLQLYHNGTDSYASNGTGKFRIGNTHSNEIKLFTNNSTRWNVGSSGHIYPDLNNTYDIGTTSYRVRNIYTNDLNLSNEGSTNDVDNTWGDYTIQEGESDLFLINNRNGKRYKFNLTEVS